MSFVAAIGLGAASLVWIWGALTGRLPAMVAALVSPSWVG